MSAAATVSVRARVRRHLTLETLLRPHTLLLVGAALSLFAWVVPWGGAIPASLRGFAAKEPWTLHGALFLLAWYAFFFVVALGGFRPRPDDDGRGDDRRADERERDAADQ